MNFEALTDQKALDIISDMFRLNEDWMDIKLTDIEDVIRATGRNTDPYLICDECGECYDETDYIDVFKRPDGKFICERCIKTEGIDE